ncbi:tetratricopeptide repeat protein, partial [bacterium]
ALPADVASNDELFLIGQHLWQYRHATRHPEGYWREALRRDPGDQRCNNALGLWHLRRGEFEAARERFAAAIERATRRNPNPYDGEAYYNLGLTLRFLGHDDEATDALGKAVWNHAWQAAGYHALGELACKRGDWLKALDYLDRAIRKDADNFRAHDLRAVVRRKLGREATLDEVLSLDPLDHWARHLSGEAISADNAVRIDLAIDMMRAGLYAEARGILAGANPHALDGTAPMVAYYDAHLRGLLGEDATEAYARAAAADPRYCFPARLEDLAVLEGAPANDARAAYYLGNLLYDRRRHQEALTLWERAAELDPQNAIVHRNLGIGAFNVLGDAERA